MKRNVILFISILIFAVFMQGCGKALDAYVYIDEKNIEYVTTIKGRNAKVFVEGELISTGNRLSDDFPYPYVKVKDAKGCTWTECVDLIGPYEADCFESLIGWKVKLYGEVLSPSARILRGDTDVNRNNTILENIDDRYHWQVYYDARDMLVKPEALDAWYCEHTEKKSMVNGGIESKSERLYYSDAVVEGFSIEDDRVIMALQHKCDGHLEDYFMTIEELDPYNVYLSYDMNTWKGKFKRGDGIRLYYVLAYKTNPYATPIYISSIDKPFTLERAHGYYTELDEVFENEETVRKTRFIVKKDIYSSKRKVIILSECSSMMNGCAEILCLKKLLLEQGINDFVFATDYLGTESYFYLVDFMGKIKYVDLDHYGYEKWSDMEGNEDIIIDYLIGNSENFTFIPSLEIEITDRDEEYARDVFERFMNEYSNIQ